VRSTDTDASDTFAGSDGNWTVTITGAADETGRAVTWSCCVSGTPPTEATDDDGKQVNGCITARDDAVLTGGGALPCEATAVTEAGAPAVPWTCWVAHAATGTVSATRKQERNLTSIDPSGVGRTLST
jgi:hypothetical protein